ncbi:hypothetical protein F4808DRAFT_41446 [Astrocystis sublimbata]|nr:hypothetical protein F4808DRAFT_41446 [Astrocystis sublimbata]
MPKKAQNVQKRGQPVAAARLVGSPYVKFGWHKPLAGHVKEQIATLTPMSDSMYMLQRHLERPIDALSLRNGIFREHRALADETIVSTPALDHLDLFPSVEETETMQKIAKYEAYDEGGSLFRLHGMFEGIRAREFLLLPIEIDNTWLTIIVRFKDDEPDHVFNTDRQVTDFAIVDPNPHGREDRRKSIELRLQYIFLEGCIEFSEDKYKTRHIDVPTLKGCPETAKWQSGLVAFAFASEFLRRLKTLVFRRSCSNDDKICTEFLYSPFEEQYNFNIYRQNLMSSCAHQAIEKSNCLVRMALEVPSGDAEYHPESFRDPDDAEVVSTSRDESYDILDENTHTLEFRTRPQRKKTPARPASRPSGPDCALTPTQPILHSPIWSPSSQYSPTSPNFSPPSNHHPPTSPSTLYSPTAAPVMMKYENDNTPSASRAPLAQMGPNALPEIPGLGSEAQDASASSLKRAFNDDEEEEDEYTKEPVEKRARRQSYEDDLSDYEDTEEDPLDSTPQTPAEDDDAM